MAGGGGEREHGPALSGAERRVAVLVREGCTNREISERLFITQSTVGQHLTRIYRKMQVNRRADLVRRLQLVPAE
ncbi:helix-turn-helix domain-containing protein [Streptomyces johnsoniae]|uniref:Helix-turn-helix transcriptional regulator n=1 Tax=Streptomyces johnsoniae TaxID=3075532 RepID=A0ABU2S5Z0_9ACTN|nr:helix-turn-helix transcriptional regulator [Streptomyces sp. DSM 41886]MDT0444325.1 helix-turn-helix transcriptional regulator [Streptomyces sp. DSM 41886]